LFAKFGRVQIQSLPKKYPWGLAGKRGEELGLYSWNGTNGIRHKNAAVLFPSMVVADFGLLPPGQKKFNGLAIAS
jgi:hypothetical protein